MSLMFFVGKRFLIILPSFERKRNRKYNRNQTKLSSAVFEPAPLGYGLSPVKLKFFLNV